MSKFLKLNKRVYPFIRHLRVISNYVSFYNNLPLFFHLTHFRELGQKYKNIFIRFLVQMKTLNFAFEINWPLGNMFAIEDLSSVDVQKLNITSISNCRKKRWRLFVGRQSRPLWLLIYPSLVPDSWCTKNLVLSIIMFHFYLFTIRISYLLY